MSADYEKPAERARIISELDEFQLASVLAYIADEVPEIFGEAVEFVLQE